MSADLSIQRLESRLIELANTDFEVVEAIAWAGMDPLSPETCGALATIALETPPGDHHVHEIMIACESTPPYQRVMLIQHVDNHFDSTKEEGQPFDFEADEITNPEVLRWLATASAPHLRWMAAVSSALSPTLANVLLADEKSLVRAGAIQNVDAVTQAEAERAVNQHPSKKDLEALAGRPDLPVKAIKRLWDNPGSDSDVHFSLVLQEGFAETGLAQQAVASENPWVAIAGHRQLNGPPEKAESEGSQLVETPKLVADEGTDLAWALESSRHEDPIVAAGAIVRAVALLRELEQAQQQEPSLSVDAISVVNPPQGPATPEL